MADIDYDALAKAHGAISSVYPSVKAAGSRIADTVQQGVSQLKQTSSNVSTIKDALGASGIDVRPPDAWDLGAAYNQAKATLTGLWRGYIAPHLR